MPKGGDMSESTDVVVARVGERVGNVEVQLEKLTETVQKLADAAVASVRENARIDTVQAQLSASLRAQEGIWTELRRVDDKHTTGLATLQQTLAAHQQAQARAQSSGLFEMLKLLIAGAIGVAVSRLGGR